MQNFHADNQYSQKNYQQCERTQKRRQVFHVADRQKSRQHYRGNQRQRINSQSPDGFGRLGKMWRAEQQNYHRQNREDFNNAKCVMRNA